MTTRATSRISRVLLTTILTLLPATVLSVEPLRVCVDADSPPYSLKHGQEQSGFDLAVSRALANALDRPLRMVWYESEIEKETSPALAVNALLSGDYCDLVAGCILYGGFLGEPASAKAQPPDIEGGKQGPRHKKWVRLNALAPSKPYHFIPLTVVLAAGTRERPVRRLSDLRGVAIGTETGTLSAHILSMYQGGVLRDTLHTFVPGEELLHALNKGEIAAALVELHRVDAYRARYPSMQIRQSGYQHPIGFNVGFVALAKSSKFLTKVDQAIEALMASGTLPNLAKEAGMTYVAPRGPAVLKQINLALIVGSD